MADERPELSESEVAGLTTENSVSDTSAAEIMPDPPMALITSAARPSDSGVKVSRTKARVVKTKVTRLGSAKRVRTTRWIPKRKTRWVTPQYYGLGMPSAQPRRTTTSVRKKRRGGATAYRRWMTRNGITIR